MAEILIPIKEFPQCCGRCPCFHAETPMYCQADKTIRMTAPYGKRMDGCPIVEIPPHGGLKDADRIAGVIRTKINDVPCEKLGLYSISNGAYRDGLMRALCVVDNTPTVLEATE